MRSALAILAAGGGLWFASLPLAAHHSFAAEFDATEKSYASGHAYETGVDESAHLDVSGYQG
jgi:hypothetical protein